MAQDETIEATSETTDVAPADVAPADVASAPKRGGRKLLMIALAALMLLGGGGAAGWFFFLRPPPDKVAEEEAPPESFVDVPPMQVAMRSAGGGSRMLKLHVMLVPGTMDAEELTRRLPQLIDRFQPFVRELRPEDLSGSAATFRVKEELLIRSRQLFGPDAVRDVLIQDLMQQ